MNIHPLEDKVLIKPKKSDGITRGGIALPESAEGRPQEGEVLAVGPGRLLENGERGTMSIEAGDTVIYSKYGGTEIEEDGDKFLILDQSSILARKIG